MSDFKTEQRMASELEAAVCRPAESQFIVKTIRDRKPKDAPRWADLTESDTDESPKAGGAQNQFALAGSAFTAMEDSEGGQSAQAADALQDSEGGQSEQAADDVPPHASSTQDAVAFEVPETVSRADEGSPSSAKAIQDSTEEPSSGAVKGQGKGSQPAKGAGKAKAKGKGNANSEAQKGQGKGPLAQGKGKGKANGNANGGMQKGQGKKPQAHPGHGKKGFKDSFHIPIGLEEFSWKGNHRFIGSLILGPWGANMKAIVAECNDECRMRLCGDRSGTKERDGSESRGPLTLCVSCHSMAAYETAWWRTAELIAGVHAQYDQHCIENNKPRRQLFVNVIPGCRPESC